jgi:hypothetical protein
MALAVLAVMALMALGAIWFVVSLVLYRQASGTRPKRFNRKWMWQHAVMGSVILLYFLYTSTTREVISLFSCQQVDNPARLPQEAWSGQQLNTSSPAHAEALFALRNRTDSWARGFWTSDTNIQCGSPQHLGLMIGLGVPGLVFVVGMPVGLWLLLWRISKHTDGHRRLRDPEVSHRSLHPEAHGGPPQATARHPATLTPSLAVACWSLIELPASIVR